METIYIYPTTQGSYEKITETPAPTRRNIGCIERNGHLNIKPKLKDIITAAGGDFSKAPGYRKLKGGATNGVGGSGYDSCAKFPDAKAAKDYLKKYSRIK